MKRRAKRVSKRLAKQLGPADKAGLLLLCHELIPALGTRTMEEALALSGAQEDEVKESLDKYRIAILDMVKQMRLEGITD